MKKVRLPDVLFTIVNSGLLLLFAFICIYPFYYIFIYSISDPAEALRGITLFPKNVTLANYKMMLRLDSIPAAFFISTARAVLGTIVTIICCSFFAYLLSNEHMKLKKVVYRFAIFTMYINAGIIPWYLTMRALGLKDNFLLYILPNAISAFYIILLKTFMEQLPASLVESAKLDGAGHFVIFTQIVFPLSISIVATIAVFSAVGQWGQWFDNLLLISDQRLNTLQYVLYTYLNSSQAIASMSALDYARGDAAMRLTPQSIQVTITMVTTLPILIVYPFMQKYFVKGIMMGAVKG